MSSYYEDIFVEDPAFLKLWKMVGDDSPYGPPAPTWLVGHWNDFVQDFRDWSPELAEAALKSSWLRRGLTDPRPSITARMFWDYYGRGSKEALQAAESFKASDVSAVGRDLMTDIVENSTAAYHKLDPEKYISPEENARRDREQKARLSAQSEKFLQEKELQKEKERQEREEYEREVAERAERTRGRPGIKIVGFHCGSKPPDQPWSRDFIFSGEGVYGGTGKSHIRPTIYFAGTPEYAMRYCNYASKAGKQPYLYACLLTLHWDQLQSEPSDHDKYQREFTVENPDDIETLAVVAPEMEYSDENNFYYVVGGQKIEQEMWSLALDVYRKMAEQKLAAMTPAQHEQAEAAREFIMDLDGTEYPVWEALRVQGLKMSKSVLVGVHRKPSVGGFMKMMAEYVSPYSPYIEYGKRLKKAVEDSGNKNIPDYVWEAAANLTPGTSLFKYVWHWLNYGFEEASELYDANYEGGW